MNTIHCEICLENYKDGDVVPRVLDCGHSICTQCTTTCIQSSAQCPVCAESLNKSSAIFYPINYELIKIVKSLKHTTFADTTITSNYLKSRAETMRKELTENLPNITARLNSIEKLLADDVFDVDKTEKTLSNLGKLLGVITEGISLRDSMTHQISDYESDKDFVYDIYGYLINSEELYAVTRIDGKIKFARLTITSIKNTIILHAFENPVKKSNIHTIWFDDLQRIFSPFTSMVFLEIDHLKFIMKTLDSSITSQFTKYCTGEVGPVYKGANVATVLEVYKYIPTVFNFKLKGKKALCNLDLIFDSKLDANYADTDIICLGSIHGGFKLVDNSYKIPLKTLLSGRGFVVGVIENQSSSFRELKCPKENSTSRITDSGIILDLDKQFQELSTDKK